MVRYNRRDASHRMDVNRGRAFIDRDGNLVPIPTPSPVRRLRRLYEDGILIPSQTRGISRAQLLADTGFTPRRRPIRTTAANTRPAVDLTAGLSKKNNVSSKKK